MTPRESLIAAIDAPKVLRDDPTDLYAVRLFYARCAELVTVHGPALLAALDFYEAHKGDHATKDQY